jgi:hypothetical protein
MAIQSAQKLTHPPVIYLSNNNVQFYVGRNLQWMYKKAS